MLEPLLSHEYLLSPPKLPFVNKTSFPFPVTYLPSVPPPPFLRLTASFPPSSSDAPNRRLRPSRAMELCRWPLLSVVRSHQVLGIYTHAASLCLSSKPPFPPIPNPNIENRTIPANPKSVCEREKERCSTGTCRLLSLSQRERPALRCSTPGGSSRGGRQATQ